MGRNSASASKNRPRGDQKASSGGLSGNPSFCGNSDHKAVVECSDCEGLIHCECVNILVPSSVKSSTTNKHTHFLCQKCSPKASKSDLEAMGKDSSDGTVYYAGMATSPSIGSPLDVKETVMETNKAIVPDLVKETMKELIPELMKTIIPEISKQVSGAVAEAAKKRRNNLVMVRAAENLSNGSGRVDDSAMVADLAGEIDD